jgi:hypothetical protein
MPFRFSIFKKSHVPSLVDDSKSSQQTESAIMLLHILLQAVARQFNIHTPLGIIDI